MEEVSSLNEGNFKNYEHEETSLITGLSEIDAPKENEKKEKKYDNLNMKMKDLEKKCEELLENVKGLELKNSHVWNFLHFS